MVTNTIPPPKKPAPETLQWVCLSDQHYRLSYVRTVRLVGYYTTVTDMPTGWVVQRALSGLWWGLHEVHPDAGPFRTMEEARMYVEATYALTE